MIKGPPPPKEEQSGKDRVLDTLANEPSLITGIIKALLVLGVGYGYFSEGLAGVIISTLTALIVLLLSFIGRSYSYGPKTVEKILKGERRP